MTEREKVIRGLEKCKTAPELKEECAGCPYDDGQDDCIARMAADALALLKAQEPRWISVKARLPESAGVKVLVAAKSDESVIQTMAVFTAFLGYGDWKWYTQDVGFMKNAKLLDNEIHPCWTITHWMLPPEPPKEES